MAAGAGGGPAVATGACVGEDLFIRFDRVCFLDVFRALTTPSRAAAETSSIQRTRRPVSCGGILIACFGMSPSPRASYLAQFVCRGFHWRTEEAVEQSVKKDGLK